MRFDALGLAALVPWQPASLHTSFCDTFAAHFRPPVSLAWAHYRRLPIPVCPSTMADSHFIFQLARWLVPAPAAFRGAFP
jgi:hypothetical protein